MNKKIAIIFAYTANNLGDDLFVMQLCRRYPNETFYIAEIKEKNKTLENINNLVFSPEMKKFDNELSNTVLSNDIKAFYSQFDACVMIGGSIFMQQASSNWWRPVRHNINRIELSKKLFVIGANFGPFTDGSYLRKYTDMFAEVEDICFRDTDSLAYFPELKNIRYAPDVIFTLPPNVQESKNQVFISLIDCGWKGRPETQRQRLGAYKEAYISKLVELCSYLRRRGYTLCLSSFCKHQGDEATLDQVLSRCQLNGITDINICKYDGDVDIVLEELAKSKYIIATRFHAMILGWLYGKPTLPVIYDNKQKAVIRDLGFKGDSCLIEDFVNKNDDEILQALECYKGFDCFEVIKSAERQFEALDNYLKG